MSYLILKHSVLELQIQFSNLRFDCQAPDFVLNHQIRFSRIQSVQNLGSPAKDPWSLSREGWIVRCSAERSPSSTEVRSLGTVSLFDLSPETYCSPKCGLLLPRNRTRAATSGPRPIPLPSEAVNCSKRGLLKMKKKTSRGGRGST